MAIKKKNFIFLFEDKLGRWKRVQVRGKSRALASVKAEIKVGLGFSPVAWGSNEKNLEWQVAMKRIGATRRL